MLKLGGKVIEIKSDNGSKNLVRSITTNTNLPLVLRQDKVLLVKEDAAPEGFAHYLIFESSGVSADNLPKDASYTVLADDYSYLGDGDVIRLSAVQGSVRVLFRASSKHNSLLVTEQCNHYCLMCSQPPKAIDDSWILDEIEQVIPLIPKETSEIGFTGGEPTLAGDRFIDILKLTKNYLPRTAVHILSNGRSFSDLAFTHKYASINHHDAMVGIPLYSDDPALHDYIVQATGAFDETIRGILNLKRYSQKVEVRIVIHKQSIQRLTELAEFIARNLLFVDHVALMGLEMMGFTRANLPELWIDPYEYKDKLSDCVDILTKAGLNLSVYNHQLCLINPDVLPYYRKSISDWKNEYAPECKNCFKMQECGGFFSSGILYGYSKHLSPYSPDIHQQSNEH
jgi:His-Xaa-Ser system radical SAM maturase HxsC